MTNVHIPPEPADVAVVRDFAATETVTRLTKAASRPAGSMTPIVISVVRNERARLPDFLDHHRRIGVRRFAMIDNNSYDGTRDWLARQPDVDLFVAKAVFDWRRKHGWIMQVIDRLDPRGWWLLLDADEHTVFADCETRAISDLVAALARRGVRRARAALVDMYAKGSVGAFRPEPGARLADRFPYFDAATYTEHRNALLTARTGGPRRRLLAALDPGFRPALSKYPLFRLTEGETAYNPHMIWPPVDLADDPCLIALKHFKFDEGFHDKIADAVKTGVYWNDSAEYRAYVAAVEADPGFSLFFDGSRRYRCAADFVDTEVIDAAPDLKEACALADRIKRAERRRLANRLAVEEG